MKQIETVQVEQDIAFQRQFWRVERIGWVVFLTLLVLAALGFGGGVGPVNQATASNQQLEVQYQPFARRSAPTDIDVAVNNPSGKTMQLVFERSFIHAYQVQYITPQPSDEKASEEFLIYEFSVPDGTAAMQITFSLEPDTKTIGNISGRVGLSEDELLHINQWIYP